MSDHESESPHIRIGEPSGRRARQLPPDDPRVKARREVAGRPKRAAVAEAEIGKGVVAILELRPSDGLPTILFSPTYLNAATFNAAKALLTSQIASGSEAQFVTLYEDQSYAAATGTPGRLRGTSFQTDVTSPSHQAFVESLEKALTGETIEVMGHRANVLRLK